MKKIKTSQYILFNILIFCSVSAMAANDLGKRYFQEGVAREKRGDYYSAARYFFQTSISADSAQQLKVLAQAHIANCLVGEGLYQSASYFFLKALGSGYPPAIQEALKSMNELIDEVGDTVFKRYLLHYVNPKFYSPEQHNYYLYIAAKDAFNASKHSEVISLINQMHEDFIYYPQAIFLRATAYSFLNQTDNAINDYKFCSSSTSTQKYLIGVSQTEMNDLNNRCIAGIARTYYQAKQYEEAEHWYDEVEVASLVWPQVQYERAWNSVARGNYNRALGKLVTYKAPGLSWFVNSEIEMLRAMSYLQMCMYQDVQQELNEFVAKYSKLGIKLKEILNASSGENWTNANLYDLGSKALRAKIQSEDPIQQIMNRFVRSSHFIQLASTAKKVSQEQRYLDQLGDKGRSGLGGYLREILDWRLDMDQNLGGQFIRDRLTTEYRALLQNVQTVDIIKLEVLRRAKQQLESRAEVNEAEDIWGNKKRGSLGWPEVAEHQYGWSFNGEFWADELGNYVFALRPQCE